MKKVGELLVIGNPDEAELGSIQEKLLKYFSSKYIFVYYIPGIRVDISVF